MSATQHLLLSLGVHHQHTLHRSEDLAEMYASPWAPSEFVQMLVGVGFDSAELMMPLVRFEAASLTLSIALKTERAWRAGRCPEAQACSEAAIAARLLGNDNVMSIYRTAFPFPLFAAQLREHLCQSK